MCAEDNKKYKISVICVYNNINTFNNQLLKSLQNQDVEFELIALNNVNHKFKSASEALNYGSKIAKGDILVYSHQDIFIKGNSTLNLFYNAILKCPIGTIIGTQGVKEPNKVYFSNITYGTKFDSAFVKDYKEEFYEVSCVDEGFFGMRKETWNELKFNEVLCDNWHLYCVEACLHARKLGGKVFVFPIQLHHFSMGTISLGYMKNLKLLCKEYHNDFKYIWTTCYKVRTNWLYINCLYLAWITNRAIRGKLK